MKISEARQSIKLKLEYGLITEDEARNMNNQLSRIQASNKRYKQKLELYKIWS